MRTKDEHIPLVNALTIRWRAYAQMAIAFGREIARLQKHDPQQAYHKAEMLEVWLRFALFAVVGDLARLNADGADHRAHSKDIQHLRQIAAALAALSIVCAKMKRESRAVRAWRVHAYAHRITNTAARYAESDPARHFQYFDSS